MGRTLTGVFLFAFLTVLPVKVPTSSVSDWNVSPLLILESKSGGKQHRWHGPFLLHALGREETFFSDVLISSHSSERAKLQRAQAGGVWAVQQVGMHHLWDANLQNNRDLACQYNAVRCSGESMGWTILGIKPKTKCGFVMLGKSYKFSEPHLSHMWNGNKTLLTGIL